jgi:hypothetical protein
MQLPIWLNEGLADLYSSLELHGQQAMVGRPLESRVMTLSQQQWMDWNALFAVRYDSPFYNEKDKMSIFYAQSWALTHMLAMSPAYMPGFSSFLLAVANGLSTPEALQKVYGKTVLETGKDVAAYVRQTSLRAALFNVTLSPSELHAQVTDLPDLQTGLALFEKRNQSGGATATLGLGAREPTQSRSRGIARLSGLAREPSAGSEEALGAGR